MQEGEIVHKQKMIRSRLYVGMLTTDRIEIMIACSYWENPFVFLWGWTCCIAASFQLLSPRILEIVIWDNRQISKKISTMWKLIVSSIVAAFTESRIVLAEVI